MNETATAEAPAAMTTAQLFAFPDDDGMDRELIRGELRERTTTTRNRPHSAITMKVGQLLLDWSDRQPEPRGEVVGGEAGFRIHRYPDTTVGIDVAYVSPELAAATAPDARFFDGAPVLAVEILSPSDRHQTVAEKIEAYLDAGVSLVWQIDPKFRTVTVFRADAAPRLFNETEEISADPFLKDLRFRAAEIFGR